MRGHKEEGTTTTPFDMTVLNDLDRFHLVIDSIDRLPLLGAKAAYAKQAVRDKLIEHKYYVRRFGDDMPEVRDWQWEQNSAGRVRSLPGATHLLAEITPELSRPKAQSYRSETLASLRLCASIFSAASRG